MTPQARALGAGLAAALPYLRCPVCGSALQAAGRLVACSRGHRFDVARQGYVSLLTGSAGHGTADTADMVAARQAFLAGGHQDPLAARIAERGAAVVDPAAPQGCVVDAGAGTGFVLAAVLGRLPRHVGIALDLSKHALRRAARAHPRIGAVAADTWRGLPLRDAVAEVVLCVFAPRNAAEFRRVLRPAGALVVVTPTRRHLTEVVGPLGLVRVDARKAERLAEQLEPCFAPVEQVHHEQAWVLGRREVETLVTMGPSARHTDPGSLRGRLQALPDPVTVTCSVEVTTYRAT